MNAVEPTDERHAGTTTSSKLGWTDNAIESILAASTEEISSDSMSTVALGKRTHHLSVITTHRRYQQGLSTASSTSKGELRWRKVHSQDREDGREDGIAKEIPLLNRSYPPIHSPIGWIAHTTFR